MAARFRIRTSQGQEISFASLDIFAEFVRSGDLAADDVVYDAETREWSSALTHPVVLQIEASLEESGVVPDEDSAAEDTADEDVADEDVADEEDSDGGDVALAGQGGGIGLELAPEPDRPTPEEEAAAFVERMEAERAGSLDFGDEPRIEGLKMEQGSSGLVEGLGITEAPEPPTEARREEPRREEPRRPSPPRDAHRSSPSERGGAEETPRWIQEAAKRAEQPRKKKGSGAFRRYAPFFIVGLVVVGAGVYLAPDLLTSATTEESEPVPEEITLEAQPGPSVEATEEALRARAEERFLSSTRALLRDLPAIPETWLGGAYLATPSDYPEVRESWDDLLTWVRFVRDGDDERYRAGYARAFDDAATPASERTLRIAGAVADFQSGEGSRAAHYDRIEALATAALRGHDALVEMEGMVAYEPAPTAPVSGDRVAEAVGRNAEAQALLDEVLELILGALDEPEGPGDPANLEEWVWDGILGAVTG